MGNEPAENPEKGEKGKKDLTPCCSCCCEDDGKKVLPEHLRDGNIFENRSCTDCLMVILYAAFFCAWIAILGVALKFGKPSRIIMPENFRGDLCGDGALVKFPNVFVPKPSRPSYGLCVAECPSVNDFVCNNDLEVNLTDTTKKNRNTYFNMKYSEFEAGKKSASDCASVTCSATKQAVADRYIGLMLKLKQKKCFPVFYPSGASLFRCIPGKAKSGTNKANATLMSLANESATGFTQLANNIGVGSFFMLGFAELKQTWRVILISAVICMGIAFIWVFLLRWILAPIVYLVIFLILGVLIGLGFVFKYFAEDLESGALPGESGVENQAKLYRALQYALWLIAAIYVAVMANMMQRIKIALAIMKEASKAFTSAPSMIIIPLLNFIALGLFIALFVVSAVYIQTMGSEGQAYLQNRAEDLMSDVQNASLLLNSQQSSSINSAAVGDGGNASTNFTSKTWITTPSVKTLHLVNFFGILWTGNSFLMFGYMTLAMTVCSWYFSATQVQLAHLDSEDEEQQKLGREKETVPFVVGRAAWATLANHLGTVFFGSLLIAIIQFIRAVFTYIAENYLKTEGMKDNWAAKCAVRCIECCLWYIEQVVKIISKNAFIITAIRNTNFCVSAYKAVCLLITNAARLVILTMLSAATIFLVKCFIVGGNFFIAFALIKNQALTENEPVESGLFPLFLIIIMSFVIASLFLNVYEACVDTIFLCFLVDEDEYESEFMPASLAKIIGMFAGAEQARLDYESKVNEAMDQAYEGDVKKK